MTSHEYALALFQSCTKSERAEVVDWFHLIEDIVDKTPDYIRLMTSPNITDEVKKTLLAEVFSDAPKSLLYFLYVLVDQDRFAMLLDIASNYQEYIYEEDDVMVVDVITAKTLSEVKQTELTTALQSKFQKQIILVERIQPSMIGGIRLEFQGKVIDQSIHTQVQRLQQSIRRKVS
jgi:F-type H+-transporting ATPase subunit delta